MRRLVVWTSICLLVLGSALSSVKAQISIAGDINNPNMLMDISLRDADLNEVLTALFNTTDGKYQLQVGNGVVGRIPRLQLVQTPFDKALDAILGTEYSYTRESIGNGSFLYHISGRNDTTLVPDTSASVPSMAPATLSVPTLSSTPTDSTAGIETTSPAVAAPKILTLTTSKSGAGGMQAVGKMSTTTGTGAAATTETSYVTIIKVNYLDLPSLCGALGGSTISLYIQASQNTGISSGMNNGASNNNNMNNNNFNSNNNNSNNSNNNSSNNNNRSSGNYNGGLGGTSIGGTSYH